MTILYKDESYAIVGAAIEVHRELGPGFLEAVYQEALEIELAERGIPFVAQQSHAITYKNRLLTKTFVSDFVCYEKIVVEIKALNRLTSKEHAQVLNYLKATNFKLGILINFGSVGRLERKRFVK